MSGAASVVDPPAHSAATPGERWFVYMVRCADGSLYTGITTDVERRLLEHRASGSKAARYLRGKGPIELVLNVEAGDRVLAAKTEYRIKQLAKADKEKLLSGDLAIPWAVNPEAAETETAETGHGEKNG
ncbi:MAG: GIY-YIG nuclease family protein [Pseudohongiellaceae bacterium]